jgi:hypothetical protein
MATRLVNALTPGMARGTTHRLPTDPDERRALALSALPTADDHPVLADPATLGAADVDDLYRLAGQLRLVYEKGDVAVAAEAIGRLLDAYRAAPVLIHEEDGRWRLHFHSPFAGAAAACGAGAATALAVLVEAEQFSRLGVCAARNCDRVYYDQSRNGRKSFCSAACMNRAKTAEFRRRRAAES